MTPEQKTAAMQRARWNARENAPETEVPSTTRVLADRERQGRRRQELRHRQPRGRARVARATPSGVLDADIWGFSVPRMLGIDDRLGGADGKIHPNVLPVAEPPRRARHGRGPEGRVDGVPRRRRVDGADVARPDPHPRPRAVPHRRALGRHGLPARRHAPGHRRHPDGARPAAPAGRDARGHHAGPRTRRRSRHASPTWRGART